MWVGAGGLCSCTWPWLNASARRLRRLAFGLWARLFAWHLASLALAPDSSTNPGTWLQHLAATQVWPWRSTWHGPWAGRPTGIRRPWPRHLAAAQTPAPGSSTGPGARTWVPAPDRQAHGAGGPRGSDGLGPALAPAAAQTPAPGTAPDPGALPGTGPGQAGTRGGRAPAAGGGPGLGPSGRPRSRTRPYFGPHTGGVLV